MTVSKQGDRITINISFFGQNIILFLTKKNAKQLLKELEEVLKDE